MKTNTAMSTLLLSTQPAGTPVNEEYLDFIEWEDCILIDSFACNLPRAFHDTCFSDRTDCEASINHLHLENLSLGLDLIYAWEKMLRIKYPDRSFVVVLSCDFDEGEVTTRFYQNRINEPKWVNDSDLESYKDEALLILEILE